MRSSVIGDSSALTSATRSSQLPSNSSTNGGGKNAMISRRGSESLDMGRRLIDWVSVPKESSEGTLRWSGAGETAGGSKIRVRDLQWLSK